MVNRQPLPGSERTAEQGSTVVGQCDPAERIEVFVILRRQRQAQFDALMSKIEAGDPSVKPLSREAFAKDYGAAPDDIAKVKAFAAAHGLTVVREDPAARQVLLGGTIAQFQTAFGVKLEHYQHHTAGQFRGRTGTISVPDDLHGIVQAVLGLDNRPQARPHFRIRPPFQPAKAHQQASSFTPPQLASLYQFPQGDGSGECVGIIELGGGYNASDLKSYSASLGVASPKVTPVGVDQGSNQPSGDPNGPDGEVTLDIEIVGAIVPGATIAVYFTQNSDAGFIDAVSSAVHDTTNKPTVISISWGGPESSWTAQSLQAFNSVLQTAAALGVTVCAASGDSGSSDGSGSDQVDFPASSPYVLACGGTSLTASGTSISHEVVWNDGAQGGASGGGVSRAFPVPVWQQGLSATSSRGAKTALSGRGVPDVAGDASPVTGYSVLIDGTQTVVGGTSAVAPLWSALIARINAANGQPAGFINPKLYKAPGVCHDITQGNNGSFAASPGWDACTGLGSPDGQKVAAAL
jgi:kumamolisin